MSTLVPRRWFRLVDDVHEPSDGGPMLRKAAVVAVVANPHANGNGGTDLQPLIDASAELGRRMAEVVREVMGPHGVESYGKGAIVGLSGEQEHANALLTTTFATPLREAIGGGKAWISSMTKRGTPGCAIDIPLAHKDALYVRSHYDGVTVTVPDAPMPDEIAVIIVVANRGRVHARVGGLRKEQIRGEDGLT